MFAEFFAPTTNNAPGETIQEEVPTTFPFGTNHGCIGFTAGPSNSDPFQFLQAPPALATAYGERQSSTTSLLRHPISAHGGGQQEPTAIQPIPSWDLMSCCSSLEDQGHSPSTTTDASPSRHTDLESTRVVPYQTPVPQLSVELVVEEIQRHIDTVVEQEDVRGLKLEPVLAIDPQETFDPEEVTASFTDAMEDEEATLLFRENFFQTLNEMIKLGARKVKPHFSSCVTAASTTTATPTAAAAVPFYKKFVMDILEAPLCSKEALVMSLVLIERLQRMFSVTAVSPTTVRRVFACCAMISAKMHDDHRSFATCFAHASGVPLHLILATEQQILSRIGYNAFVEENDYLEMVGRIEQAAAPRGETQHAK